MKQLGISRTIFLLLGLALFSGGLSSSILLYRCSLVSQRYDAVIQNEISQALDIRLLQVNFKKQVQAWKDILLRGRDDAALAKYTKEFHSLGNVVDESGAKIQQILKDPAARGQLDAFLDQHKDLERQYDAALLRYNQDRDASAADTALKGKDRAPTNSLDGAVDRLSLLAHTIPAQQAAQLQREQNLLIVLLTCFWIGLAVWGFYFVRSLSRRLDASVDFVRQIAAGDLTAQSAMPQREDELGDLVNAMLQMRDWLHVVVTEMQLISGSLTGNANDVTDLASRLASASSEQRHQASQVSAALEEMIASVHEVTGHCNEAALRASETGSLASRSSETVDKVANSVRNMAQEARQNAQSVLELGERSHQVGQIITLIQEIAAQTNLLALNAAIESARAGEHGRGFAVVAGEVRRLAERTTSATKEIASAIESIQQGTGTAVDRIEATTSHVEGSVATANEAATSLQILGAGAVEVSQRIDRIAQAASEQSEASRELGASMNEIADSIHTSSEGAEQAARAAEGLLKMAEQLKSQVTRFKTA